MRDVTAPKKVIRILQIKLTQENTIFCYKYSQFRTTKIYRKCTFSNLEQNSFTESFIFIQKDNSSVYL